MLRLVKSYLKPGIMSDGLTEQCIAGTHKAVHYLPYYPLSSSTNGVKRWKNVDIASAAMPMTVIFTSEARSATLVKKAKERFRILPGEIVIKGKSKFYTSVVSSFKRGQGVFSLVNIG